MIIKTFLNPFLKMNGTGIFFFSTDRQYVYADSESVFRQVRSLLSQSQSHKIKTLPVRSGSGRKYSAWKKMRMLQALCVYGLPDDAVYPGVKIV